MAYGQDKLYSKSCFFFLIWLSVNAISFFLCFGTCLLLASAVNTIYIRSDLKLFIPIVNYHDLKGLLAPNDEKGHVCLYFPKVDFYLIYSFPFFFQRRLTSHPESPIICLFPSYLSLSSSPVFGILFPFTLLANVLPILVIFY